MTATTARAILVAAAICATMSGCGSARTLVRNARITGAFEACGGPLGFDRRGSPCEPGGPGSVSAFNTKHQLVASQPLRHGRFSLLVPPGRLTLVVQHSTRSVTAKANRTIHANVTFQMK